MEDSTKAAVPPPVASPQSAPAPARPRGLFSETQMWMWVLVILAALFLIAALIRQRHLVEQVTTRLETTNLIYMLSAVLAGGAVLLLSGVIALAPLLSLALHQSYDSIFEVLVRLEQPSSLMDETKRQRLASDGIEALRRSLRILDRINPPYYAIWLASAMLLTGVAAWFICLPWIDVHMAHLSMVFFFLSCILCCGFAFLSFYTFVNIKPGATKLNLLVQYFDDIPVHDRSPEQGRSPERGKVSLQPLWGLLVLVICAVAALWGGSKWTPAAGEPLSIALNATAVASGPLFVADDSGFATKAGLKVREVPFAAGRLALDALTTGQVDVATAAETPVVLASVEHPNLRIVLTIAQSEYRIVARRDSGVKIASVADLRGRKIATLFGTSADYFAESMLKEAGVRRDEVTWVNLEPQIAATSLQKGDVDAVSVWEPYAWKASQLLGEKEIEFVNKNIYSERFNLVTTTDVLDQPSKRAAIEKLVAAMIDASTDMGQRPMEATDIVGRRVGLKEGDLKAIWYRFNFPANLDWPLLLVMQNVETWSASSTARKARPADALRALVDPTVLKAVAPQRVLLR